MSRVRSSNTRPERALRKALWQRGCRYRIQHKVDGVRIDIAFPRPKVAVFVDGCFWHGCPTHYREPPSNQTYWAKKLLSNKSRDERNRVQLEALGWTVIRVWECEIDTAAWAAAERVLLATMRTRVANPKRG